MTDKHDKDVQGVALYLEFRKPNSTCQIIVTPAGFTLDDTVPHALFRRVLHSSVTKRKWRVQLFNHNFPTLKEFLVAGKDVTREEGLSYLEGTTIQYVNNLETLFSQMAFQGYKLVKDTPIYVEITRTDLESVKQLTMPAKLWQRVKSSRVALGFPETITD